MQRVSIGGSNSLSKVLAATMEGASLVKPTLRSSNGVKAIIAHLESTGISFDPIKGTGLLDKIGGSIVEKILT